jgi:sulfur-oxidizing protein SoxY
MNHSRRNLLKMIAALAAAGVLPPGEVLAQDLNKAAFDMKSIPDALRALGAGSPAASDAILIKAPEIAENGAVVPIAIESRLAGTESIALLIDKNPQPLAASFAIPAGTEASVSTRVKMGQSSDVYALVKAEGRFYITKKEIKITLGGCGG